MKILFIQPTADKRGHYGLWTSKLCQAIAKQGHDLCLFTNKIYPERFLDNKPEFRIIEWKDGKYCFDRYDIAMEKKSPLYWLGYFKTTYVMTKHALQLCKKEKFDAIFLTDVEYLTATVLLKYYKRYLPPVIWHVQAANFTFATYCGSWLKKAYKTFQREIFKSTLSHEVRGFAVLGEFHKQQLQNQLLLPPTFPIRIIPDGADIYEFACSQLEARKKIGLDYEGPVLLFLGMLRKDKGIDYLIKAIANLQNEDFKLIIAGAPVEWSVEEIKALIPKDIEHKIVLHLDYVSDELIPMYYTACDVILFPYCDNYTGGCGPLTKGAVSYAKPVIVTNVSDMGRMVKTYQNGLIAKPGDVESLTDMILRFLQMSLEKKQIMSQSSAQLAQKHSWENVAKQLIEFLNNVGVNAE